jgi:predicted metal-dependent enzyme (double-stranded beta helix superfamily)
MINTPKNKPGLARRDVLLGAAGLLAVQACRSIDANSPDRDRGTSGGSRQKIDLERFVQDCITASREDQAQAAVKEVLARGVSDPAAMLAAVGEPTQAGINVLHRSPTLTIFAANWAPQMNLMPHNHLMWALIGIFTGREDNILWRRSDRGVTAYGAEALFEGDVAALPDTAIHSVTNPLERFTGGIHIYGGDFFATTRSQWHPETLEEQPSDGDVIRGIFERANERMRLMGQA